MRIEMIRKKRLLCLPSHYLSFTNIFIRIRAHSFPYSRFAVIFSNAERINRKQTVIAFVINQIYVRNRIVFFSIVSTDLHM
jgi:hypothetical protein